jgi:hypothetical protein
MPAMFQTSLTGRSRRTHKATAVPTALSALDVKQDR